MSGNMGNGTVKLSKETTAIEGTWQAKRDPSTVKPIDKLKVNWGEKNRIKGRS
jgi:hypothetical protein